MLPLQSHEVGRHDEVDRLFPFLTGASLPNIQQQILGFARSIHGSHHQDNARTDQKQAIDPEVQRSQVIERDMHMNRPQEGLNEMQGCAKRLSR